MKIEMFRRKKRWKREIAELKNEKESLILVAFLLKNKLFCLQQLLKILFFLIEFHWQRVLLLLIHPNYGHQLNLSIPSKYFQLKSESLAKKCTL